jgi:periodic tryptophan protein 2
VSPAGGPAGTGALPGTGGGRRAPAVRCRALALAPTGASWAAGTTEGLLLYALDAGAVFDPTDLAEDVTPAGVAAALAAGAPLRGALLALRLHDDGLLRHALLSTRPDQARAAPLVQPARKRAPALNPCTPSFARGRQTFELARAWDARPAPAALGAATRPGARCPMCAGRALLDW